MIAEAQWEGLRLASHVAELPSFQASELPSFLAGGGDGRGRWDRLPAATGLAGVGAKRLA